MAKLLKVCITVLIIMSVFATNQALASEKNSLDLNQLNKEITQELHQFVLDNELDVELGEAKINISELHLNSSDEKTVNEYLDKIVQNLKNSLLEANTEVVSKNNVVSSDFQPLVVDRGSYYTARVWSGIPSGGWGYINQDFTASVTGNRINSINFLGDSYSSGVAYGSWSHTRSWVEYTNNRTRADIMIRGVITYSVFGFSVDLPATFLDAVGAENGRIVNRNVND